MTAPQTSTYRVRVDDWQYYLADQDFMPGLPEGPDPTSMPNFRTAPNPDLQTATGCVFIASGTGHGYIDVEVDIRSETSEQEQPALPELLGETQVEFPRGHAQLLTLNGGPASEDLLQGRDGTYTLRIEAEHRQAAVDGHLANNQSERHRIVLIPQ